MPARAPHNNLPPDVVQVLSFHGPVEVVVGEGERQVHGRAGVAPFEDILQLFIPIGSPLDAALLSSVVVAVQARHPEGRYSLRLTGRACAGRPLNTHADRNMLEPWIPEGAKAGGLTVVSFAAERVELTRSEAETPVRYHGPTRLGQQPRSRPQMWALAAFGGVAGPFAVIAFLAPWISLVIAGEQVPWRTLALLLSAAAGLFAVAGVRLLTLSLAFQRWREGRARPEEAGALAEAWLAPLPTRRLGLLLLVVWALLVGGVAAVWGGDLVWVALLAHGAWLWGPAVLLHLMSRRPEARESAPHGRPRS